MPNDYDTGNILSKLSITSTNSYAIVSDDSKENEDEIHQLNTIFTLLNDELNQSTQIGILKVIKAYIALSSHNVLSTESFETCQSSPVKITFW